MMQAWLEGLRERGYVVGRNLQIEYRYSQGPDRADPRARGRARRAWPRAHRHRRARHNALAVHAAAPTIPLVFVSVADPVALGLVESLAHPGGNVTGFATMVPEGFNGKQLQLFKELVPQASRIAVLINPTNPMHPRELAEASRNRATAGSGVGHRRGEPAGSTRDGLRGSAQAGCRGDRRLGRSAHSHSFGEGRGPRRALSTAGDLLLSAERTGRRTYILWSEPSRPLASRRRLCRQES